jgi:RNA recognition motif-containing protein
MYDDGQNAQSASSLPIPHKSYLINLKAFRNNETWNLVAINGPNSPTRPSAVRSPSMSSDAARAYLARYDVDRRSVFVGNLQLGTTEEEIDGIFKRYGVIEEIIIRESDSKFERKFNSSTSHFLSS